MPTARGAAGRSTLKNENADAQILGAVHVRTPGTGDGTNLFSLFVYGKRKKNNVKKRSGGSQKNIEFLKSFPETLRIVRTPTVLTSVRRRAANRSTV